MSASLAAELDRRLAELVATPESRARFSAYLDGLERDGYATARDMAVYVAETRRVIAAAESADFRETDPSSLRRLPPTREATTGGAVDG